jgi:hypothetical protein
VERRKGCGEVGIDALDLNRTQKYACAGVQERAGQPKKKRLPLNLLTNFN